MYRRSDPVSGSELEYESGQCGVRVVAVRVVQDCALASVEHNLPPATHRAFVPIFFSLSLSRAHSLARSFFITQMAMF